MTLAETCGGGVRNATAQEDIDRLGPWFHNLHLPDGTQTAPQHFLGDFPNYKWEALKNHIPEDLKGWRVLDVGCNAGFYSFQLAQRGAEVMAIDVDARYLEQAKWAAQQYGLENRIRFREMQVYDLARVSEIFDLVLFMGVFYHLRYPTLGLDIITQKVKRLLVFQTLAMPGEEIIPVPFDMSIHDRQAMLDAGWPKMAFIEKRVQSDPTNWWVPNHACVEALLRSCGMMVKAYPEPEMYICEPDPLEPGVATGWNSAEYRSATGQKR